MGFVFYNPNPECKRVGDCTVRAIAKATGKEWSKAYTAIALQGFTLGDMPSANHVWGSYLKKIGFTRCVIPDECPDCYTVADFAAEHPFGTYLLALQGHVVCVQNGNWYDTWDSGGEVPLYYWTKKEG